MNNEIFTLADKTSKHLISQRTTLDLPFIYSFPVNCCEISSLILGKTIYDMFDNNDIFLVEGYDRDNNEFHYWLEINDTVVDVTSNQFSITHQGYDTSKYIETKFTETKKTLFSDVILNNDLMLNNYSNIQDVVDKIKQL